MIKRLRKVTNGLYRGSAPSPKDVMSLHDHLGVKKIVSLDEQSGERIDRACKLLGIQQVKAYINHNRKSLYPVLKQNIKKLLLEGGPTYIHCQEGKDRTGYYSIM
jgi:protein tyrosine/serine phosphatase